MLSDYVYVFRPWREFALASLKAGRIPLWNPYNYAGAPFLGNGESAVLYPLNLLFLVLPDGPAVLLWVMIRLFIAGCFTYLFGRVVGLSVLGAGMATVGFTFSGFMIVWLLYPPVNVAIWLPALFLAGEAIVRGPSVPRVLAAAAIVCVQFLGGHPETSLHLLSAVALYVAWRAVMDVRTSGDGRRVGRVVAAFAGAFALGTAAAAVQLLPLGEYILESAAFRERLAVAPPLWTAPHPRVLAAVALLCPHCFGSSLRGDVPLGVLLGVGNFNELNGGYVGLLTLLLGGIGIALGARRGLDLFFVALAGLAFCTAYAVLPVFNLVHALPLFDVAANTRVLFLWAFALCFLAGRGTDLLLATPDPVARRILKAVRIFLLAAIAAVAIATASLLVTLVNFPARVLDEAEARIIAMAREQMGRDPEPFLALLPRSYGRLIHLVIREGTGRVLLLAACGLALGLAVRSIRSHRPLTWILPAVVVLDLFSFGRNYNPSTAAPEYPPHGALEFLRRQPGLFRILAVDGGLPPNTNLMYGLYDVRGYDSLETEAYHRFLAASREYPQPHRNVRTLYFSNFESRLVDSLNVKYVLSDRALLHPKLALVWEDEVRVYENRWVMPRAFLVYRTRIVSDAREMDRALRAPDFDPSSVVLFEGTGPVLAGPVDPAPTVRVTEYGSERVTIELSSRQAGILVLADAWFPGWRATVDGRPADVLAGNRLLRAVPVPAGSRRVVFHYDPASFRLGAILSSLALVSAVALGVSRPLLRTRSFRRRTCSAGQ